MCEASLTLCFFSSRVNFVISVTIMPRSVVFRARTWRHHAPNEWKMAIQEWRHRVYHHPFSLSSSFLAENWFPFPPTVEGTVIWSLCFQTLFLIMKLKRETLSRRAPRCSSVEPRRSVDACHSTWWIVPIVATIFSIRISRQPQGHLIFTHLPVLAHCTLCSRAFLWNDVAVGM